MNNNDTLSLLRAGKLAGATSLDLRSCGLKEFPNEVFDLAETLEVLNLGENEIAELPDDFARLKRLRILFCTDNAFRHVPGVVGQCPELGMVAFKSNRVETIDPAAFGPALRWLILTENLVREVPGTLGQCTRLQKLMLSGNRLRNLPESLSQCGQLEMIRIASNELERLPEWLLAMPSVCWLAFSGNPCTTVSGEVPALPAIDWGDLDLGQRLGEGASGVISRAVWQGLGGTRPVAVKVFKAALTSDGLPASEMAASMAAGLHPNLIPVLGQITDHPKGATGMVMSLLDPGIQTLAGPPSLASCTRDIYRESLQMAPDDVLAVASGVAAAACHLHARDFLHGDLYAHNVQWRSGGQVLLGDLGAAAYYGAMDAAAGHALERMEVRAWGILVEELLARTGPEGGALSGLRELQTRCCAPEVNARPSFREIVEALSK